MFNHQQKTTISDATLGYLSFLATMRYLTAINRVLMIYVADPEFEHDGLGENVWIICCCKDCITLSFLSLPHLVYSIRAIVSLHGDDTEELKPSLFQVNIINTIIIFLPLEPLMVINLRKSLPQ